MSVCLEKQKIRCGMVSRTARHIAIDETSGKVAVVRKSRSSETHDYVEFYNILSGWLAVPELTICPENGSIETVLFVENGELMTAHANGSVCFIDPHNTDRVKRIQISASTIWSACKHDATTIAMISHSSVLYFFDVASKMILSSISLGVESRLFDVSSNGSLVAIGSIDGIILAANGKVQQTLKLDRQNRRDPTIAWSVLFVKPSLLACGDSRGTVTLWNPVDGALLQTISCLQSHILSMVATGDRSFSVAGVDPRITELKETGNGMFEITNRRNGPVRDVRSMAVYENSIYAAGEDFDVYVCNNVCRKLLIHQEKNMIVADDTVATAGENYIDIFWKQKGEDETDDTNRLQQHYEMIHLARIFTPKKRIVTSWTISPCGQYLVIGTSHDTTIYKIIPMAKKLSKKILKTATLDLVATSFCITKELCLYAAKNDFEIVELDVTKEHFKELKTIVSQNDCGSVIKSIASGKYVAVLTTRSQIFSINTETGESRLLKVELPIDFALTSTSAFVLTTLSSTDLNQDTKKVMHEVGLSNGLVKRSASSQQLRMLPMSPKSVTPSQPIYISAITDSKLMTASYDGHWSILDVDAGNVVSGQDGPLKANKLADENENYSLLYSGLRLREEKIRERGGRRRLTSREETEPFESVNSRVLQLEVSGDEAPKTSAFKLKKFGMQ
uniref:WD_REPEATS_REGION domain-containing protein n=1 Tax=Caenorhabditis tropicalis TaxID=1561998 RepID=A0A1I7USV6_9PELO